MQKISKRDFLTGAGFLASTTFAGYVCGDIVGDLAGGFDPEQKGGCPSSPKSSYVRKVAGIAGAAGGFGNGATIVSYVYYLRPRLYGPRPQ